MSEHSAAVVLWPSVSDFSRWLATASGDRPPCCGQSRLHPSAFLLTPVEFYASLVRVSVSSLEYAIYETRIGCFLKISVFLGKQFSTRAFISTFDFLGSRNWVLWLLSKAKNFLAFYSRTCFIRTPTRKCCFLCPFFFPFSSFQINRKSSNQLGG